MSSSVRADGRTLAGGVAPTRRAGITRWLAWVLPTAAALGSNLPVLGPLFGFRVLVLVVAVVALIYPADKAKNGISKPLTLMAIVWTTTGLLLSLLASDGTAAFRTMTSVSLGLLLAMAAVRITRSEHRFVTWLAQGWLLSFAVTSIIAAWELTTGQHLSNYFTDDQGFGSQLPAATFFNPNAFAVYLVTVQAILLWVLAGSRAAAPRQRGHRRLHLRLLIYVSSLGCAFLILATGSRLCLSAFVLLMLGFLALDRMSLTRSLVVSAVFGSLVWFAAPSAAARFDDFIPDDVRSTSTSQILLALERADTSEGLRVELYKSAFWLIGASGGIGVGPGNFGVALTTYDVPYSTGNTRAAHSFVGELGAEFGLVVVIGFGLLMWSVIRRVMPHKGPERSVLLASGLAFLPASLANSGYLLSSNMWAFFATMLCMVVLAEAKSPQRCTQDA